MKIAKIAVIVVVICSICCQLAVAQVRGVQNVLNPRANFHAGIHSGTWTQTRAQLLEAEKQDPHRSCPDPYCARCAEHLANYGHEFQYIAGPSQRQLWYRGTAGTIAHVTQRGFHQHSRPYLNRGQPAAVMSPEYVQTLNRAIWEQVNARNAVAAEEAAHDRVVLLTQLLADAREQLRLTSQAWEELAPVVNPCNPIGSIVVVGHRCTKTFNQFYTQMRAGQFEIAMQGFCAFCLAHARYRFDLAYVADVERELALAQCFWAQKNAMATEAVRVALLSRNDAHFATRFLRIQYKQPRIQLQDILNAMDAENSVLTDE